MERRRLRSIGAAGAALALVLMAASPASAAGPDLLTWGQNNQGQLGDGTTTNRTTPVFPTLSPGTSITSIDGDFENNSYAVLSTGVAIAWGNNTFGQLGDGTTTNRTTPVNSVFPPGTLITDASAGRRHAVWLTSTGILYASGMNNLGQLGDGTTTDRTTPVLVNLPVGTSITAIKAGHDHTLALTAAGDVLAWGWNAAGQLGDGTTTTRTSPVTVNLPGGFSPTLVMAGGNHSYVRDDTGLVLLSFGQGTEGQLGRLPAANSATPAPVTLPVGTMVTALGAGTNHGLAVTLAGGVLGWGANAQGALGDGTTTQQNTPVSMTLTPGAIAVAVSGGFRHSLVLTTAGKILATGRNSEGQLGDGTTTQQLTPVATLVGAGTTLNLVAAGGNYSMAVGTFSLTGVPLGNPLVIGVGLLVLFVVVVGWALRRRLRTSP